MSKMGFAPALAVVLVVAGASTAFAQGADVSDRVQQLEQMINAQQQQIAALQQQLVQQQAGGVEAMRVEEIKRVVLELFRDPEFRNQLPLNAGYDDGFFIRSGEEFLLKINGLMTARYLFYNKQSRNLDPGAPAGTFGTVTPDRSGLEFEDIRLRFSGHLWEPAFTYLLEFSTDTDKYDGSDTKMEYAWVNYKFVDPAQVRVGVFKAPFGRQELTGTGKYMLIDRSLANEVFNLGRVMAVMLHGGLFENRLDYAVAVSNGFDNADDSVDAPDAVNELDQNPAVSVRTVWHALYENLGKDFADESDLSYHKKPALDFGLSFAYNNDNGDARSVTLPFSVPRALRVRPTGYGYVTNANDLNITQFGVDAAFKYLGFALQGEYFLRIIDVSDLTAPWFIGSGRADTNHQQGAYVQAGYFIVPQKLEAVVRLGGVWDIENDNVWEYAGGVNYYIKGQNLKISADVTQIYELPIRSRTANFINVNDDMLLWRIQLQAAF